MFNLNFLMPLGSSRATKTFTYNDGEWVLTQNYTSGKWFKGFEIPVGNLYEAFEIIKENEKYPVFMIQGGFVDGVNKNKMLRRKRGDREDGEKPTITDRYINLVCFDVDGFKGEVEDFIKVLPGAFHNSSYIVQYSSSYLLSSADLKAHLFFWLSAPVHNTEIEKWINDSGIKNLDPSVLRAAQPIYTQRRICYGKKDPVKKNIFFVKKENEEVDWSPSSKHHQQQNEEKKKQETTAPEAPKIKKTPLKVRESIKKIMTSEDYHNELNKLALSLVNKRMPAWDIKELLKGIMESVEVKDKRWTDRYNDIDRAVDSAVELVKNPTVGDFISWVHSTSAEEVKMNFAQRCLKFNAADLRVASLAVEDKLKIGIRVVNNTIQDERREEQQKRREEKLRKRKARRAERGVTEVEVTTDNRMEVYDSCCKLLGKSKKEPEVFSMGGSLASIKFRKPETVRQCSRMFELGEDYPLMPLISIYKKPYCDLSMRMGEDVALINGKGKDIEAPYSLLSNIGSAEHEAFRPLTGIVEHPFINKDWKLVSKTGYDPETGLFAVLHKKLKLKRIDPKEAYKYLTEVLFDEFPFKSKLDEAVAVAALMTGVQRPAIVGDDGFPGFGIVSPVQSSGKTTLAQVISYSVFNRPIAATTMSTYDEEFAKHLLSILQEGHACVLFDNITQGRAVKSDILAKIITGDTFVGRQLGENKTVRVPNNTLWLFTGNGITFVGDFATRILPINIQPMMARPETRYFKREDIGEWVTDNRKDIMSAVLSLIMAGRDIVVNKEKVGEEDLVKVYSGSTGKRKYLEKIESSRFKKWDKFVRWPIFEVSGIDIAAAMNSNYLIDGELMVRFVFLDEMKKHFGDEKFTTKDLLDAANEGFDGGNKSLYRAMIDWVGKDYTTTKSIGRRLNSLAGIITNGLMLDKFQANFCRWQVTDQTGIKQFLDASEK